MEGIEGKIFIRDILHILDLQKEIYALKQGERSVTNYLLDELMNFRLVPSCSCENSYSCGYMKMQEYQSHDYVIRFLNVLND